MNKPIAYYEERYCVSSDGQILNLANNKPLKPIRNTNGYFKVALADGQGAKQQLSIHTLVARHFVPNPYNHPQVNHIDGDKQNNAAINLEWVTAADNVQHALKTGLRKGYMSADDKELYLDQVLKGVQVKDIAVAINRAPETLHKMLRTTAERVGKSELWDIQMKENRANAARNNLKRINNK